MFTRFSLILGAALFVAGSASAATFSANGGVGSSTIGSGGDYATLAAAAADFNGATPVTGNYTFFITSNLSEPTNVSFAKDTAGFTVTIKPAPATTPVVTFTLLTDNAGPSGHIVIGSLTTAWTLTPTNNFIIDGSNTVGGATRDLTLTTSAAAISGSRLVRVAGACNNVQVKNCKLYSLATSGSVFAVDFSSRNQTATNYIPTNGLIENNDITVMGSLSGQGITAGVSGTVTSGQAQTGLVIRNNDVLARTRGLFLNVLADATIDNNRIKVNQSATGVASYGIWHFAANGATGWTMNITNNTINQLQSANATSGGYGLTAIEASQSGGTYNIYNNMIAGYNYAGATPQDQLYRGIRAAGTSPANIYHNSINMPAFASVTGATGGNAVAIIAGTATDVRNNIIKFDAAGAGAYAIYKSAATGLTSDYNALSGAGKTAYYGSAYPTFVAWQGAGFDTHGKNIDPTTGTSPGVWVSATDLRFTAFPGGLQQGTFIASVPADIDGNTRDVPRPYPGASETLPGGVPVTVSGFSID